MGTTFIPMAASGLVAPVVLLEVQTAAGVNYFWSEHKAVWPSQITGANAQFLDFLMASQFVEVGSTETDTATFTIQNLSGNTVLRDAMMAFSTTELIGALVVARIWNGAAMTSLCTFIGSITEVEPDETSMQIHVEGFGNWSAIQAPAWNIDVTCPLTFGSTACGSTSPTPCDQTYGNCSQINRFAGVVTQWDSEAPNVQLAQPAPAVSSNTGRAF
jgi:hypothetical protein